jgi:nanoRNase/pAp phosphatase (c-di-AMP/oligoRNAs hydrolase)
MNRRALLRIAAGVLGGGAATAAGLSVATGGAAQTGLTLSVDAAIRRRSAPTAPCRR